MNLTCPHCGKKHVGHSGIASHGQAAASLPDDGNLAICLQCGGLGIFDLTQGLIRPPNDEEEKTIAQDPEIARIMQAWKHTVHKNARKQ